MSLNKFRNQIDKIDNNIIILLKKRLDIVKKVGEYKHKHNLKIVDKTREKELLVAKKVIAKKLNVNEKYIDDLFKRIIKESYKVEKK